MLNEVNISHMSLAKSLRGILPAVRMTTDADFALWTTSILLPVKNILQVYEGIITCAEISHPMYAPDGLDSCNFCNEGIRFFSRTALIILPDSFDFHGVEIGVKKPGSIARKGLSLF